MCTRPITALKDVLRGARSLELQGYNVFAIMADGGVLCPHCARAEYRSIVHATRTGDVHSGWCFCAADINYEDAHLYCDHCSGQIPPAYEDDGDE